MGICLCTKDALHLTADDEHSTECSGLSTFMPFGLHDTPDTRNLKAVQLQNFADLDRLSTRYPPKADIAEVGVPSMCRRLAIHRLVDGGNTTGYHCNNCPNSPQ